MTKSDRLQIRISPETKARGEALFESMGLNMSKAVNLFIEQALIAEGLPFNIAATSSVNSRDIKKTRQ